MASNGMAITESLVHAPRSTAAGYVYRNTMGMVPSAEFSVFFDDFDSFIAATTFAPAGWTTILDAGATIDQVQTAALGSTGVIRLFDATASEGAAIFRSQLIDTGTMQLTVGKRAFMEIRTYQNDVTDNAFQFGWSSATTITNPEDLYNTTSDDVAILGYLDGTAGELSLTTDKANGGLNTVATTGTMVVDTWTVLALSWDGVDTIRGYKDGEQIGSTATRTPNAVSLTPFVAALNGNGAGSNLNYVDYVRMVIER